jgi:hypothetical protein
MSNLVAQGKYFKLYSELTSNGVYKEYLDAPATVAAIIYNSKAIFAKIWV